MGMLRMTLLTRCGRGDYWESTPCVLLGLGPVGRLCLLKKQNMEDKRKIDCKSMWSVQNGFTIYNYGMFIVHNLGTRKGISNKRKLLGSWWLKATPFC